jgi:hypothetical protein
MMAGFHWRSMPENGLVGILHGCADLAKVPVRQYLS